MEEQFEVKSSKSLLLWVIGTGGLVGAVLTNWFGPSVIGWYFTPPVRDAISCVAPVQWAIQRFQWAQGVGTVVGMILFALVYSKFRKRS